VKDKGISERRACLLVELSRETYRYQPTVATDEEAIRRRMRDLAAARPRFGSPRLTVLLRREFGTVNQIILNLLVNAQQALADKPGERIIDVRTRLGSREITLDVSCP